MARVTIQNHGDTLVDYAAQGHWLTQCQDVESPRPTAAAPAGFSRSSRTHAFVNSLIVFIRATILPLLIAAFAGYAFSWLAFLGRQWMFVILVGLRSSRSTGHLSPSSASTRS